MQRLHQIEQTILANGKVAAGELEALRRRVYANDKVGRSEANFLVMLHQRVRPASPDFDEFFYQAVKDHLLADGWIDGEVVSWLRRMILPDGTATAATRQFLRELHSEAKKTSWEFERFFEDCMKQPQEQQTNG